MIQKGNLRQNEPTISKVEPNIRGSVQIFGGHGRPMHTQGDRVDFNGSFTLALASHARTSLRTTSCSF